MNNIPAKIILFDGVCNFCNYWVNFIINRDERSIFKFTALQSKTGQEILTSLNLNTTDFDTFVLVDGSDHFTKSTAALRIAKELDFPFNIVYYFIIIPKPIRDIFYSAIAKNRYKFFGRRNSCRIPTEEEKNRFLD